MIITTHGFLFHHHQLVLFRYGQCLIYPGTLAIVLFYCLVVARFLSSDGLSAMEQAGPSSASSAPLAGTFLRLSLDLASDQLYDIPPEIPDDMGLRALRVSAAIVKVMSVSNSWCIRVVAPDDHVDIGFHEVLLNDMEEEDLPFVALSELNCLRQGWPKPLFVFMSRYQHDLEQMRKECKERFGCMQSGNCTHCGTYIQQNLGKHIALFHMELAQLWRCPVPWCTVWKGTAQDCVDHLRKTHEISYSVKEANLTWYFPPWTVTRSQWSEMTRPTISGVAINTLLFSRIWVPLFHRYRIISRAGTHVAFRGLYMRRLHAFLEEMDEESVRHHHRRRAQEMAARMSLSSGRDSADGTADVSTRRTGARQTVSRAQRPRKSVSGSSSASDTVSLPPVEAYMIQALMDLMFPRFAGMGDGPRQVHAPWAMSTNSPASPASSHLDTSGEEDRAGLSSPYLDLDGLSSSDDDTGTSVGLSDLSVTLLCGSDEVFSPVNSDQVLSDVDFPPEPVSCDKRQVVRRSDASPDVLVVEAPPAGRPGDPRRSVARVASGKRMPGEVSMTVSPVPPSLDMTVACTSGVVPLSLQPPAVTSVPTMSMATVTS